MPQLSDLLLVFLGAGFLAAPAVAVQESDSQAADTRAVGTVLEARSGDTAGPALERALAALGPDHIEALFQVLREGVAPPAAGPLDEAQLRAVEGALLSMPREKLADFFWGLAVVESDPALRERALHVVGGFARAEHLALLGRLASPAGSEKRLPQSLARAFEAAFGRVVDRDPQVLGRVSLLYNGTGSGLATALVRSLGAEGSPEAVEVLGSLLGIQRPLDTFLLVHLQNGAAGLVLEPTEELRAELLRMLGEDEVGRSTAAAATLGALRDDNVVGELVDQLGRSDERCVEATVLALGRITGFGFGPDLQAWQRWYAGEERWWYERADVVLDALERARGQAFTRAVVEALARRTHRDRIARSLAQRLGDREAGEIVAACQALAQVRSRAALPELIDCTESPVGEVREAARASLTAILGIDEPSPGLTWADYQ